MMKGSSMGSRYVETSGKVSGEWVLDGFIETSGKTSGEWVLDGFSIGDNGERFVCISFHNGNLCHGCFTKYFV